MKLTSRKLYTLGSLLSLGLLVSCGGGAGGGGDEGVLRMSLTDAPACGFDEVNVTVSKVRVHKAENAEAGTEGWEEIVLSQPKKINLLDLTNGVLETLGQTALPAGQYTQIRLVLVDNKDTPLANSIKPTNGAEIALKTPSGMSSGIKLKANFEVAANTTTDLTLDFDACKSIVKRGNSGGYLLKPVITVIPMVTSGQITGYMDLTGITAAQALISAQVNGQIIKSTVPDKDGKFVLAPVPAGSYSVVVAATQHASAVVTDVPVTANTDTALNAQSALIQLPSSAENVVTGTVNPLAIGALVEARQTFGAGPVVTIRYQNVDAETGAYSLTLPLTAPKLGSYSPSGLTFADQTNLAGQYTIRASAEGYTEASTGVDISRAGTAADFTLVKK